MKQQKVVEKVVKVKVAQGIHTRPATEIVKALRDLVSCVTLTYKKEKVNAKSILSILMLAIKRNGRVKINAEGIDAHEAIERIEKIITDEVKG